MMCTGRSGFVPRVVAALVYWKVTQANSACVGSLNIPIGEPPGLRPRALLASSSIPPFSDRLIRDGKIHLARVDGLAIGSYHQSVALERTKNRCAKGKLGLLFEL